MKQLIISVLLGLLSVSSSYATNNIQITNAWVPEAPPGAGVMAGYMEIENTTEQNIDITAVSSPAFSSVEMHLSKEVDGFARMLPQKKLSIPAKNKLILKSGSYHLMLIKPKKRLLDGDKIKLKLVLSNNETKIIDISIKKNKTGNMGGMKCAAGKCGGGKCGMSKCGGGK